jgi:hypothetical protein
MDFSVDEVLKIAEAESGQTDRDVWEKAGY